MVILIGGSSHVGKTMIAHRLMRKYRCECISLDYLKSAFLESGIGKPGELNDYQMRYWMWPFVVRIIKHALETERTLILEGCYIPAEWAESFTKEELDGIRCVFLVMSEGYLRRNFDDVKKYSQIIEKRRDDFPDLERLISCSAEFREECVKTGTFYIEIDGPYDDESLFDSVDSVIEDCDYLEKGIVL